MTIDDVLEWIAKKQARNALRMINLTPFEKANDVMGQLIIETDILNELRNYILMKTNPHNREDIKRYNEKENATKD